MIKCAWVGGNITSNIRQRCDCAAVGLQRLQAEGSGHPQVTDDSILEAP